MGREGEGKRWVGRGGSGEKGRQMEKVREGKGRGEGGKRERKGEGRRSVPTKKVTTTPD